MGEGVDILPRSQAPLQYCPFLTAPSLNLLCECCVHLGESSRTWGAAPLCPGPWGWEMPGPGLCLACAFCPGQKGAGSHSPSRVCALDQSAPS